MSYVVREASNNITQVKILFNVVLIILGQHCTGENFVLCCPRTSRQHCAGKNPVKYCLNTLWTTLHRKKSCSMLSKSLQTTLHRKKILFKVVLILLGQHCTGKNFVHVVQEALDSIAEDNNPVHCCLNTFGTTFQR